MDVSVDMAAALAEKMGQLNTTQTRVRLRDGTILVEAKADDGTILVQHAGVETDKPQYLKDQEAGRSALHVKGFSDGSWKRIDSADEPRLGEIGELTMVSYNVWFDKRNQAARAHALFAILRESCADIICLQEVTPIFLALLRDQEWVRDSFALSDSIGTTLRGSFAYGVIMLVRRTIAIDSFVLHSLPSEMNRAVLVASFPTTDGQGLKVATVHLESLGNKSLREAQLAAIFSLLDEDNSGAVLLGDMNYDDSTETHSIPPGYKDCWLSVNGDADGATMPCDDCWGHNYLRTITT